MTQVQTSAASTNGIRGGHAPDFARPHIRDAAAALGDGELTDAAIARHIAPLFSRVLQRREIYLANHSLGRPLDATADDVQAAMDAWYTDMDDAWSPWLNQIMRFRAGVAHLIGAARTECIVPKTSAGQGLRAVINAIPKDKPRIVATRGEFDSIDFILKTYAHRDRAEVIWVEPASNDGVPLYTADAIAAAINAAGAVDLVIVSQIVFATGQMIESLDQVVAAAKRAGALSLLDTYHSAGVIPVGFHALGFDFAIGGSYKYTRGGPGACWLAINPRHLTDSPDPALRTLDTGWFAKRDTFSYHRTEDPQLAAGGDAWLESTPPILTAYQAIAGLELTLAIGVDRLRNHNLAKQDRLAAYLREAGVPTRGLPARGAFLLVPHTDAAAFAERLKQRGVNIDVRNNHARYCPDILTTDAELRTAAQISAECLGS